MRRPNGSRYVIATSAQIATRCTYVCTALTGRPSSEYHDPAGQLLFHSFSRSQTANSGRAVDINGVVIELLLRSIRIRYVYDTSMELLVGHKKVLTASVLRPVQTAFALCGL